jgi:hypothetical protein
MYSVTASTFSVSLTDIKLSAQTQWQPGGVVRHSVGNQLQTHQF